MNQRLQTLLEIEHLSPAQFADSLGIRRGGISHILSGRNKPSFDLLEKILLKYPNINAEWLITGKGKPVKDTPLSSLSVAPDNDLQNHNIQNDIEENDLFGGFFPKTAPLPQSPDQETSAPPTSPLSPSKSEKIPARVTVYFSDGTYSDFFPFSVPSHLKRNQ